jgi:hypothetical protein
MFVVAVMASIIASQAMISGTFSIIQQSLALGCFPRVKIVHTSAKYEGQVYIPEVNYLLMVACVCVTLGFKTTTKIGNAYGNPQLFTDYFSLFQISDDAPIIVFNKFFEADKLLANYRNCRGVCNDSHIILPGTHHANDMENQHISCNCLCAYNWNCGASVFKLCPLQI